jgi:hypothetical protein
VSKIATQKWKLIPLDSPNAIVEWRILQLIAAWSAAAGFIRMAICWARGNLVGQHYGCGLCGHKRAFEGVIRVYHTPEELGVLAWPCWCEQCGDVSLAEYIPKPAEVLAEVEARRQRNQQWKYRIAFGPIDCQDDDVELRVLAHYDLVLDWSSRRQSAGRCLFCGSINVSLAAERLGQIQHPGCGGLFECKLSIFGGIRSMTKEVFSEEGVKLSEEQVIA